MSARRPPPPFPVNLITGFLGAGKTSLLNKLLADPALAGAVVLINEFGEIGLDHLLVEKIDGDMVLLASGCLCCTIRGDLVAALEDLLRKRDNDRMRPFDRVVIETTGLADPAPILQALMGHPYLGLRYKLDGIIAVVDAVNGAATLDAHAEARRQVAVADRIVLSKSDLAPDPATRAALDARLAELNPGAPRVLAQEADAALLRAGLFDPAGKIADVALWLGEAGGDPAHAHADDHAHDHHDHHGRHSHAHHHDVNRHGAGISAFSIRRAGPLDPRRFQMFLDLLRSAHGPKLLRMKGLVALADAPDRPVVLHGAQHLLHPPVRLDAWPSADHDTRLVFIVDGLDRAFVEGLFAAAFDEPAPDRPDSAALFANPLAPSPGGLLD